jgi:hypothetical protein
MKSSQTNANNYQYQSPFIVLDERHPPTTLLIILLLRNVFEAEPGATRSRFPHGFLSLGNRLKTRLSFHSNTLRAIEFNLNIFRSLTTSPGDQTLKQHLRNKSPHCLLAASFTHGCLLTISQPEVRLYPCGFSARVINILRRSRGSLSNVRKVK